MAEEIKEAVAQEAQAPEAKHQGQRPARKGDHRGGRPGERRGGRPFRREEDDFNDRVVAINKVTKVVMGGKHMRFDALVVVGDGKGRYGFAMRKSGEVPDAIKKSLTAAKKSTKSIRLVKGTIAHEVEGSWTSTKVVLKPAPAGTGIVAGGAVRAVLELAGIKNVVSKVYGSRNALNVVRATDAALQSLKSYDKVMVLRGLKTEEEIKAMHPAPAPKADKGERAPRHFDRRAPRKAEKGDK
ncbi:MAG: 30S ribosomal protein S5 [Bacilli bacterium]|nr:30S ribosomal protein S5 [Bacilli bacterium]